MSSLLTKGNTSTHSSNYSDNDPPKSLDNDHDLINTNNANNNNTNSANFINNKLNSTNNVNTTPSIIHPTTSNTSSTNSSSNPNGKLLFRNTGPNQVMNMTNVPVCKNCLTSTTPLWRRDENGAVLCNACGLFLKLHGKARPISLKTNVIKSRNRKSNSNHNNSHGADGCTSSNSNNKSKKDNRDKDSSEKKRKISSTAGSSPGSDSSKRKRQQHTPTLESRINYPSLDPPLLNIAASVKQTTSYLKSKIDSSNNIINSSNNSFNSIALSEVSDSNLGRLSPNFRPLDTNNIRTHSNNSNVAVNNSNIQSIGTTSVKSETINENLINNSSNNNNNTTGTNPNNKLPGLSSILPRINNNDNIENKNNINRNTINNNNTNNNTNNGIAKKEIPNSNNFGVINNNNNTNSNNITRTNIIGSPVLQSNTQSGMSQGILPTIQNTPDMNQLNTVPHVISRHQQLSMGVTSEVTSPVIYPQQFVVNDRINSSNILPIQSRNKTNTSSGNNEISNTDINNINAAAATSNEISNSNVLNNNNTSTNDTNMINIPMINLKNPKSTSNSEPNTSISANSHNIHPPQPNLPDIQQSQTQLQTSQLQRETSSQQNAQFSQQMPIPQGTQIQSPLQVPVNNISQIHSPPAQMQFPQSPQSQIRLMPQQIPINSQISGQPSNQANTIQNTQQLQSRSQPLTTRNISDFPKSVSNTKSNASLLPLQKNKIPQSIENILEAGIQNDKSISTKNLEKHNNKRDNDEKSSEKDAKNEAIIKNVENIENDLSNGSEKNSEILNIGINSKEHILGKIESSTRDKSSFYSLDRMLQNEEEVIRLKTRVNELEMMTNLYKKHIYELDDRCKELENELRNNRSNNR